MVTLTERIDIRVNSRQDLDDHIEAAVRDLKAATLQTWTRGILITRHVPGHYTAELSDQVPFGMTRELFR
jgi:hypothetical protein